LSILHPAPQSFAAYPAGAALFPGYAPASAKFDSMIAMFAQNPHFVAFYRKVHINVLNELYHYLMSIYMNFNLQHAGIIQNEQGDLSISIPDFLQTEQQYAINSKTLIVNHLMAIIESQFNGAIRSYAKDM